MEVLLKFSYTLLGVWWNDEISAWFSLEGWLSFINILHVLYDQSLKDETDLSGSAKHFWIKCIFRPVKQQLAKKDSTAEKEGIPNSLRTGLFIKGDWTKTWN